MREQVMRTTKRHRIGRVALIACALAGAWLQVPAAQVACRASGTQVPALVTINPVHMALMNNGKVLIVAGSGNVATETNFRAAVWDPQAGTLRSTPDRSRGTCSATAWSSLPDGRVFINGGNSQYDPFFGEPRNARCSIPPTGTLHRCREHGARAVVSDGHDAGRRPRHDVLRVDWRPAARTRRSRSTRSARDGVRSTRRVGRRRSIPRMHLLHRRQRVFYAGSGRGSQDLQPGDADVVGGRRQHATTPARGLMARRCCCR